MKKCCNRDQRHVDFVQVSNRLRAEQPQDTGETMYIGVIFHVVHTKPNLDLALVRHYIETIRKTLNEDFGRVTSDSHIFSELYLESYPLFKSKSNQDLYLEYLKLSASANIEFIEVASASYLLKGEYNSENSDLEYWDQLLKIETAPAVKPDRYLNLWVCVGLKSPFLGYAQFPKVFKTSTQNQYSEPNASSF